MQRNPRAQRNQRVEVVNVHKLGENFIEDVSDVRWSLRPQSVDDKPGELLQFKANIRGWKGEDRVARRKELLSLKTDIGFRNALLQANTSDLLFLPQAMWPSMQPTQGEKGWWYRVKDTVRFRKCQRCGTKKTQDEYHKESWSRFTPAMCKTCQPLPTAARKRPRRANSQTIKKPSSEEWVARARPSRKGQRVDYCERGSSESDEAPSEEFAAQQGLLLSTADPRYVGRGDDVSGGDVIFDCEEIRSLLRSEATTAKEATTLWLTTQEMGWALTADEEEIHIARDAEEGKVTKRQLAPAISAYIRTMHNQKPTNTTLERKKLLTAAWELDQVWGEWSESPEAMGATEAHTPYLPISSAAICSRVQVSVKRGHLEWEQLSTPLVAEDPPLLPDTELAVRVGQDLFLDEELPKPASRQGYVSVTETSLIWKSSSNSQIFTYQGLTTNMDLEHGWTVMSSIWHHLRAHHTTVDEHDFTRFISSEVQHQQRIETEGYRSPSWRMLKALQSINKATTVQGESAVAAPPFFQTAGRGQTKFWGNTEGPTVFLWEGLDDDGRAWCRKTTQTRKDWVVWSRTNAPKGDTSSKPFEEHGRQLFCGKAKNSNSSPQSGASGRALRCKGWWTRGAVETSMNSVNMTCWVHKESSLKDAEVVTPVAAAWEEVREKDECEVQLQGPERNFWLGTEVGLLGGYNFRGITFGIDGSNSDGAMGAGCCCLEEPSLDCHARVGREQEGTSSNRPELGSLLLALRTASTDQDALIFSDNESVLKTVKKWVGEGGKATLANTPDADILRGVLAVLAQRIKAGAATFLVKVKAHKGEPLNERADTLAEQGRNQGEEKVQWNDRTHRLIYTVHEKNESDRPTVWTNRVRDAMRRQAGREKLRRVLRRAADEWARRAKWVDAQGSDRATQWRREVASERTFTHATTWNRQCAAELEARGGATPATGTWCANFLTREGQSREELGKWLTNNSVPEKRRKRMLQMATGSFPCGAHLSDKLKCRSSSECELCRKVLLRRGEMVFGHLPKETIGHIQSAGCLAQKEAVTKAHNDCIKSLMEDIEKHGEQGRTMKFVTMEAEQTLRTLWSMSGCEAICSKDQLWAAAKEEERSAQSMENAEADQVTDDELQERFWNKRPDGVVLDHEQKICFLIEFKRTMDQWPNYRERAEERAEKQYCSLVRGLEVAGRSAGWTAQQIIFVGGTCGSVQTKSFAASMAQLQVATSHREAIRSRHARKLLEVSERVLRSYYAQKHGSSNESQNQHTGLGKEHMGHDTHL